MSACRGAPGPGARILLRMKGVRRLLCYHIIDSAARVAREIDIRRYGGICRHTSMNASNAATHLRSFKALRHGPSGPVPSAGARWSG